MLCCLFLASSCTYFSPDSRLIKLGVAVTFKKCNPCSFPFFDFFLMKRERNYQARKIQTGWRNICTRGTRTIWTEEYWNESDVPSDWLSLYLHMKGRKKHVCPLMHVLFIVSEQLSVGFAIIKNMYFLSIKMVSISFWFVTQFRGRTSAPLPLHGQACRQQPGAFACRPPLTRTDISHGTSRVWLILALQRRLADSITSSFHTFDAPVSPWRSLTLLLLDRQEQLCRRAGSALSNIFFFPKDFFVFFHNNQKKHTGYIPKSAKSHPI